MSLATSTTKSIRATVVEAGTPTIYNIHVPTANTEVSSALLSGVKSFIIKVRGAGSMKIAFTATESTTNYVTVEQGAAYSQDGLNFSGKFFVQINKAGQVVELLTWT